MQAEPQGAMFWHYLNTGLGLAVLGGLIHVTIRFGRMEQKLDTLWDWWRKEINRRSDGG
jgi:hypothetical protein